RVPSQCAAMFAMMRCCRERSAVFITIQRFRGYRRSSGSEGLTPTPAPWRGGDADADGDDACDAREIVRDSGLLDRPRTCSAISAAVSSLVAGNTITNSSPP